MFGGGRVLESVSDANPDPKDNIRPALALLELEDLPIVQIDTGGKFTGKIFLNVHTGHVYLRKTTRGEALNIEEWPEAADIS